MLKTTALAIALAFIAPFAVKAETVEKYDNYQVSCEAATCSDFNVKFEGNSDKVAQTRRTRTRRTRSSNRLFEDFYVGASAGLLIDGDGLDLGFQGSVFGGTWYNEYIGADAEFTFAFADLEGADSFDTVFGEVEVDDNVTLLGFFLNPRFQYKFDDSNITAFASPGIGIVDGEADTDLAFQLKAGAEFPVSDKLDAFAQGRFQTEGDTIGVEGGIIYNISK